jgi:phosphate transport system ATP-binding protein
MQQAQRISGFAGFLLLYELVEFGPTQRIFMSPRDPRTADFVLGKYG